MFFGKMRVICPRDEIPVKSKLEKTKKSRNEGRVMSRDGNHNAVRDKFYFGKTRF